MTLLIGNATKEKLADLTDFREERSYMEKLLERAIELEWGKTPKGLIEANRQLRLLRKELRNEKLQ